MCELTNSAGDQINIPPTVASARTQTAHILYYQSMKVSLEPFMNSIYSRKQNLFNQVNDYTLYTLYYNLSTAAQNKSLNKNIIFHPSLPNKMLFIIALLWISPNTEALLCLGRNQPCTFIPWR